MTGMSLCQIDIERTGWEWTEISARDVEQERKCFNGHKSITRNWERYGFINLINILLFLNELHQHSLLKLIWQFYVNNTRDVHIAWLMCIIDGQGNEWHEIMA